MLTGHKDTDLRVLLEMDDREFLIFCGKKESLQFRNKYINKLCKDETLWQNRLFKYYSKFYPEPKQTWKNLYLSLIYRLDKYKYIKDYDSFVNAINKGHLDVIKYLMSLPNLIDSSEYNNAIRLASEKGHLDVVKYLMSLPKEYKVEPASNENDAIKWASENDYLDVIKYSKFNILIKQNNSYHKFQFIDLGIINNDILFKRLFNKNLNNIKVPLKTFSINKEKLLYMVKQIQKSTKLTLPPPVRGSYDGASIFRNDSQNGINPEYIKYASDYANTIKHISFDKYMKSLIQTVNNFNNFLEHDNSNYYLITGSNKKSNYWISTLIYKYLKIKPLEIYDYLNTLFNALDNLDEILQDIHIVYTDDGLYSGQQMGQWLQEVNEKINIELIGRRYLTKRKIKISIIVPYITTQSIKNLEWKTENSNIYTIILYYHKIMKTVAEKLMFKYPKLIDEYEFNRPLIYFDHKMPDAQSVDLDFLQGLGIKQNDGSYGFIEGCYNNTEKEIECPIPPYK